MGIPMKLEKALLKESPAAGGGGLLDDAADMLMSTAGDLSGFGSMLPTQWSGRTLHFKFNPDRLALSKSANFREQPRPTAQQASSTTPAPPQYVGSSNRTLSFTVFLDEWDAPAGTDVADMVQTLQKLMDPPDDAPHSSVPLPPRMSFHWGKFVFTGYVTKADASFTLFRRDGSAARAEVQVTMTEHIDTPGRQNPTSGGPPGRRTRRFIEGDNLQLVAYREYGDPSLWRAVAEANGIDDPFKVPVGAMLLLPSKTDARAFR